MLNNGAVGLTRDQIQGVLGFGLGATSADVNSYYGKLVHALIELDLAVTFAGGNSLWVDEVLPVLPAFRGVLSDSFGAESFNVDFSSPATVDLINGWGNAHTNGLIPRFIEEVSEGTVLMLLNALYFKGLWSVPFAESSTYSASFHVSGGSERAVSMMTRKIYSRYGEIGGSQWLELPFGNGAFSMLFVLPAAGVDPLEVLGGLSGASYHAAVDLLSYHSVEVHVPRFSLAYEVSLNASLQSLGLSLMFTHLADFSLLSSVPLSVSLVRQKSVLKVTESGTEASSITSISMVMSDGGPSLPPPVIHLDRPFLCFLKEYSTGSLLFAGIIRSPDPVE
jgi:serpin B